MAGIAPKLPLELDQTDGFRLTKTIKEIIDILKKEYQAAVKIQSKGSQYL